MNMKIYMNRYLKAKDHLQSYEFTLSKWSGFYSKRVGKRKQK